MADNPSVAAPASGTYGEKTDLVNLTKALPMGAIGNPSNQTPPVPPVSPEPARQPAAAPPGRPAGPSGPPGVPAALLAPTDQANTPVNTPLAASVTPTPGASDPRQARMAILDALVHDPGVSPDTQAWAKTVIAILLKQPAG